MDEPEYRIFSLTKMTGRESKQLRTAIFLGFETPLRSLAVCLAGGAVGAFVAAFFWRLMGSTALLIPLLFAVLAWWLFEHQTSRGLKLRTWRAMRDTYASDLQGASSGRVIGKFILCGQVISLEHEAPGVLQKQSMPVRRDPTPAEAHPPPKPGEEWWPL